MLLNYSKYFKAQTCESHVSKYDICRGLDINIKTPNLLLFYLRERIYLMWKWKTTWSVLEQEMEIVK